jgi:hypothetical protein
LRTLRISRFIYYNHLNEALLPAALRPKAASQLPAQFGTKSSTRASVRFGSAAADLNDRHLDPSRPASDSRFFLLQLANRVVTQPRLTFRLDKVLKAGDTLTNPTQFLIADSIVR